MMTTGTEQLQGQATKNGFRGIHILWIVMATILVTAAITYWVVRTYIYAKDFTPVELNHAEQQVLNGKLKQLGYEPSPASESNAKPQQKETDEEWLKPQRYNEKGARREVFFSER
ncbi:MAG: hypothetical protein B6D77_07715, partial [gamma proteobacterium symbiont of Ctena orbiculata]